jgi:starvation-inducible DNA-binding protein
MEPNIDIHDNARAQIAALLSKLLADESILSQKTRSAHWNIVGPDFHAMHGFFESQYHAIEESIDGVAERIRTLGHDAPGSLAEMLRHARLGEIDGAARDSRTWVSALLADHESIIIHLRADARVAGQLGDDGTNDFLIGLMQNHEKAAWMLRAGLQAT